MKLIYIFMALLGGAGLSIQAAINSRLSAGMGNQPIVATLISFMIGGLCLLIFALSQADWHSVHNNIALQPWWRWIGGMLGAGIVFTSIFLAPQLGVANTMFLFIIGQLVAGMVIDGLGLIQMPVRPIYWWKFVGMTIMCVGLILFMFGGRWFKQ
ncbi:DMT family transporter [Acinetobacter sp. 226]|uniref:DMT family transporter n=1 Tax=Acinetobacter sp. 226 TaxID=3114699 RepID=UPI003A8659A2